MEAEDVGGGRGGRGLGGPGGGGGGGAPGNPSRTDGRSLKNETSRPPNLCIFSRPALRAAMHRTQCLHLATTLLKEEGSLGIRASGESV